MAKTLIIYPFADVNVAHSKSSSNSAGYVLINEDANSQEGYLQQSYSTSAATVVSSFSSLRQASNVTLGKIRINSIDSVNLYLSITKGSNATLRNINIFGSVSIDGNTYQSASYNPTAAVSTSARQLAISNANINQVYSSISNANIGLTLSTSGRYSSDSDKYNESYLRIYNANVTISYDDVFDCAVQIVSGNGIASASASANEVIDGEQCTFSSTVETGYIFDGWYDNEDFDGDAVSNDPTFTERIFENTTLYPKAVKEGVVPPEEDPTKIFHSITISSINAKTSPSKGTTNIEEGTNKTIKITPKDPRLTLATDNGTDISSQLVGHGTPIQYPSVTKPTNASYGFTLNSSTGYYESENKGQQNSAAVCRLNFNLPVECLVTIEYINYAEAENDYGIFGNIDSALGTTNSNDTNAKLVCNNSTYNVSTPQTITYEVQSGSHYIDIKFRKNGSTNLNNDSLQFKIVNIDPLAVYDFYYTYELTNVQGDHSLNFVFGDVEYYFVVSQTDTNTKLYPYGQTVVLPGDEYRLTIVPESKNETVSLTDNGVDVTSNLEILNVESQEDGETVITKNYVYKLTNIQQAHTLNIQTTKQVLSQYVKVNQAWRRANFFVKVNNTWTQLQIADIYNNNGVKWLRSTDGTMYTGKMVYVDNIK